MASTGARETLRRRVATHASDCRQVGGGGAARLVWRIHDALRRVVEVILDDVVEVVLHDAPPQNHRWRKIIIRKTASNYRASAIRTSGAQRV